MSQTFQGTAIKPMQILAKILAAIGTAVAAAIALVWLLYAASLGAVILLSIWLFMTALGMVAGDFWSLAAALVCLIVISFFLYHFVRALVLMK